MPGPKDGVKGDSQNVLSIEDTGTARSRLRNEPAISVFEPYSGGAPEKPRAYKKDLRKVDEWMKTRQRADALKREEASIARADALRQGRKKPE